MFVTYISVLLLLIHQTECAMEATAVLYQNGTNTTGGTLKFVQTNSSTPVNVIGPISGLVANSTHGFHVHTYPVLDYSPNCLSAGDHFNPYNTSHGPMTADITGRHVGDLGNLVMNANGSVYVNFTDSIIQLYNMTQSIINRTIIIHFNRDDGGLGNSSTSNTTGNSGDRILCGLIVRSTNTTSVTTTPSNKSSTIILNMKLFLFIFSIVFIIGHTVVY
ncbi:hypothetical protein I4U23_025144 [Adineta vaga]|nr:hypothetical protein I4U23_025144 [Adineta vaga]